MAVFDHLWIIIVKELAGSINCVFYPPPLLPEPMCPHPINFDPSLLKRTHHPTICLLACDGPLLELCQNNTVGFESLPLGRCKFLIVSVHKRPGCVHEGFQSCLLLPFARWVSSQRMVAMQSVYELLDLER